MSLLVSYINIARLKPGVRKQYMTVAVSKTVVSARNENARDSLARFVIKAISLAGNMQGRRHSSPVIMLFMSLSLLA